MEDLREEKPLKFSHLRLRRFSEYSKMALELSIGLLILIIIASVGVMVWNAAHSNGLVIEEFSVPADMAAKGVNGQVVASQLLDNLTAMQNASASARPARSYANNWGDNLNVQIPDTGVSLAEVYRFLKGWLGHDTHITGEVYLKGNGIAITARTGGEDGATFTGSEDEMDSLLQKTAEHIYGIAMPYRYGNYLESLGRYSEARPIFERLSKSGDKIEGPFGYFGMGIVDENLVNTDAAALLLEKAAALAPDNPLILIATARSLYGESGPEQGIRALNKALPLLSGSASNIYSSDQIPVAKEYAQAHIDYYADSFHDSSREFEDVLRSKILIGMSGIPQSLALAEVGEHDVSAARAALSDDTVTGVNGGAAMTYSIMARVLIDNELQNWSDALSDMDASKSFLQKSPGWRPYLQRMAIPFVAYAEARLGRIADAEAHVGATPPDCYYCLINRGRIAEVESQHARADWWFARAVKSNSSIPFAYAEWGEVLLARGDPDGAIAKFTIANQKGPKFADPLEMWGEALMAKNRSDLALAKFTEADKYAPNWGRLHLKWGEALWYAGKKDEAQKQFTVAAGLDLSSDDKAKLAKVRG
jgi:tetratricopeptide (TPR) repeat protein